MIPQTKNFPTSLVAHRGNSDHYPENSLESVKSALLVGAQYVEVDIQITKDNVVVLSHDASLKRMTGVDLMIADTEFCNIKDLPAAYKERFDDQFVDCRMTTLQQFCDLAIDYPQVTFFIEIKNDCIKSHGNKAFDIILEIINKLKKQIVIISFNHEILSYVRTVCELNIGWVIAENKTAEKENTKIAQQLLPEYLFMDKDFLPIKDRNLWKGNWFLAVYTVNSRKEIKDYEKMGFHFLETNNISKFINPLEK